MTIFIGQKRALLGARPAWTLALLFASGEIGVWYDPSDISTLFQDAAGTIPVTAYGQPVGRILDKSGNGIHATQSTSSARPLWQEDTNGKPGLKFDAVNDFLVTSSINLSAVDSQFTCAGVRKLSDATTAILCEFGDAGTGGQNGNFSIAAPFNASNRFASFSEGTAGNWATTTSFPAPVSAVVTAQGKISSDTNILRINGVQVAQNTGDQGTGNYGNHPLYIGCRGGSSLWFNGFLHQLVIRGGALPDAAELAAVEAYFATKSGV
ncbi:MAG TPA: hypothetical protein DCF73_00500 [Rhodobiaceae bacterium]|nr:hypothetical protein [Rhodobiaceae bacterium]